VSTIVKRGGFNFEVGDDSVARVRDIDIGEKLGLSRPRDVRKTIADLIKDGEIVGVITRDERARVKAKGGGTREQPVTEYWLDKRQAFHVAVLTRTPQAAEIRRVLIDFFVDAENEALRSMAHQPGALGMLVRAALLPEGERDEWEQTMGPSIVAALSSLYGLSWTGGRHPLALRSVNRKIQDTVMTSAVMQEVKRRNPTPSHGSNHPQHFQPAVLDHYKTQLGKVETLARGSASPEDFWMRMEREYRGGMLQLGLK
jgi:hypothetical protein